MAKINDGREAEALADCETLSKEPDHPVALYGLAVLAYQHGRIKTAVEALTRAHELDAYEALYTEMLAVLYAMAGNLSDGVYFAKLSVTRQVDEITIALLPGSLPLFAQCLTSIKTKPLLASAEALEAARNHAAAAELYERHLVFFPGDAVAIRGLARCLLAAGRPGQALTFLAELPDGDDGQGRDVGGKDAALTGLGTGIFVDDVFSRASSMIHRHVHQHRRPHPVGIRGKTRVGLDMAVIPLEELLHRPGHLPDHLLAQRIAHDPVDEHEEPKLVIHDARTEGRAILRLRVRTA